MATSTSTASEFIKKARKLNVNPNTLGFSQNWVSYLDSLHPSSNLPGLIHSISTSEDLGKVVGEIKSGMAFAATMAQSSFDTPSQPAVVNHPSTQQVQPVVAPPPPVVAAASAQPAVVTTPPPPPVAATTAVDKTPGWMFWVKRSKGATPAQPAATVAPPTVAPPPGGAVVAPPPGGAANGKKPQKKGIYYSLSRTAFRLFISVLLLMIMMTLLTSFSPGASAGATRTFETLNNLSFNANWSGLQHAWNNLVSMLNVPWVRAWTQVFLIILVLATLDTAVSNFTGGDLASMGGFFTIVLTIPLVDSNPPLAVGMAALGLVMIRRDRDEGKGFQYYLMGAAAVLLFINFFARDYQTWETTNPAWAMLKFLVGFYFTVTNAAAPWIIIALIVIFYASYLQDMTKDGTLMSLLSTFFSGLVMFGFVPLIGTIMGVVTPGGNTLQNYAVITLWVLAIPIEGREVFARKADAGKGIATSILLMIVFLAVAFFLAFALGSYSNLGMINWYGIVTLIISLLLGVVSVSKHQDVGEAAWKVWVADWETLIGDIISHPKLPLLFYPTLFNIGWLILGLLVITGKLP